MEYLIDTHVLLWMSGDYDNLSAKVNSIVLDKSNKLFISLMSFREIAIKHSSGKLELDISIQKLLQFTIENNLDVLPVRFSDFELIDEMPFYKIGKDMHKDPFDRILIAQSMSTKLPIISIDEKFDMYSDVIRIW